MPKNTLNFGEYEINEYQFPRKLFFLIQLFLNLAFLQKKLIFKIRIKISKNIHLSFKFR